jgi:hypothetical protein
MYLLKRRLKMYVVKNPRTLSLKTVNHLTFSVDVIMQVTIKAIAMLVDQELYFQRKGELALEKQGWSTSFPVFFYDAVLLPGEKLHLQLFEPRYKLMMQRIINTTRSFAYVPLKPFAARQGLQVVGELALVAEVKDVEFFADGRCFLEALLCKRSTIVEHYVEDGTHGLSYCRLVPINDIPVATVTALQDASSGTNVNSDTSSTAIVGFNRDSYLRLRDVAQKHIQNLVLYGYVKQTDVIICNVNGSNLEAFTMWLAGASPLSTREKHLALEMTSGYDRLKLCVERLDAFFEERPRHPGVASAVGSLFHSLLGVFQPVPAPAPAPAPAPIPVPVPVLGAAATTDINVDIPLDSAIAPVTADTGAADTPER